MPFRGRGNTGEQSGWDESYLTGFGRFLRQAREYKGVSVRDVERKTRIPRRHLHALETEQFDHLPPLIYARGIVRNYAQFLGLDPMDALARFEQSHGQRSGGFQVVPAVKTTEVPSHWAPNFAIIAFMVIMSAVIFAWMYSAYFAPPDGNGNATEQAVVTPEPDQEVAVLEDDHDILAEGGGESLTPLQNALQSVDDSREVDDTTAETESEESTELATATEEPEVETPTNPTEPTQPTDSPTGNLFAISVTQPVWVQAAVDGVVVLDDVVQPGTTLTYQGETLAIVSGNAPHVNVTVNGENRGAVGDVWDASNTYP